MNDEKTSLTAALRLLAEQEHRTSAEHSTPGELAAYHEGTLPPQDQERVREHLAHCRLCSDLLLDLAGFADLAPPPGVPELTDAEVEEDWQALRARIREREPAPVVPFPAPAPPAPAPVILPRKRRPWRSVAAALVAVAAGWGAWMIIPKPELAAKDFYEGENVRGGGESQPPIDAVSPPRRPAVFHFYPESYPHYEGRILSGRKVIWKTSEVEQTSSPSAQDWEVSFKLPGATLESGRYEAVLYGLGKGPPEPVGSIEFEVDDR
ncbi:MAG: zf-HC2 domain-containing protein [Acidobacteriota bacterium]